MAYSFGQTATGKENASPSKISLSLFITKTARPFACFNHFILFTTSKTIFHLKVYIEVEGPHALLQFLEEDEENLQSA